MPRNMMIRDVERRAAILATSDNESARLCATEALARLADDAAGRPWPVSPAELAARPALPQSWLESAAAWIDRGAEHAYGFRRPEGW